MSANDDVTLRVALVDEASRPLAHVRKEVQDTAGAIGKTGTQARTSARELTSLDSAASRVGSSFGRMASSLLIANRHSTSLGASLRGLGLGVAAYQAGQFGLHAVASFQNANTALTGLVGSQKQATALMQQLAAIKSPFGSSALTSSAQSLLAMGVGSDQVVGSVQAIADAVSRVGGGSSALSSVTQSLADISSSAQVSEGQLSSLRSQGLDAFSVLGKSRGLSGTQMQQAMSLGAFRETGKDAYNELIAGFSEQAKGSAASASGNLSGSMAQVGDNAAKALNAAIGPHTKEISMVMNDASKLLGFMAAHPRVTESLAAFLVFREVAGPIVRTATAMTSIARDLRTVSTVGEAAKVLLGVEAATGGGAAGAGSYGPGMPVLVGGGSKVATAGKWGTRVGKYGSRGAIGGLAALTASQLGGAGQNYLTGHYGHGNDGGSWHWQDAARGFYGVGKDAGEGALIGASFGGPAGALIGAVGGTALGSVKESWDYFHHKKTYGMGDAGKADLAAQQQVSSLLGGVQINVHGADVDAIMRQLTPALRAQVQAAIAQQQQQASARKQVAYP